MVNDEYLTLGIDSGTQSVKVIACDPHGTIVARAHAAHPPGCSQAPAAWWSALVVACRSLPAEILGRVAALSAGAQQHGCVPLGPPPDRPVLAKASLWCDTSSADEAERLNGLVDFAAEVGSRLVASFTITKLARVPESTAAVCLPHDWLTFRLTGRLVTDRGDASGTGWWSATQGVRRDLLELARRPQLEVPEPVPPEKPVGRLDASAASELGVRSGILVGPGSGDNMAAALGIGARAGEVVVSLGTSGTVFAVSPVGTNDKSGLVAGFCDATGRFLPLVCTLNCTHPVDLLARWFGLSVDEALTAADRPTTITFLPYLAGERTPDLPGASGALIGLREDSQPADLLSAAVHGAASGLAVGLDALVTAGVPRPQTILLVGGGAAHATWQKAIASAMKLPVLCPTGADHAARGMAVQARAVLEGVRIADVAERWRPDCVPGAVAGDATSPAIRHLDLLEALEPLWRKSAPP